MLNSVRGIFIILSLIGYLFILVNLALETFEGVVLFFSVVGMFVMCAQAYEIIN